MPSGATDGRWRWGLRTRITVYTSAVIAATLAAAFFWSVYNLRAELEAHNDLFLRQEFTEFAKILNRELQEPANTDPLDAIRAEAEVNKDAGMFVVVRHDGLVKAFPESNHVEPLARAVQSAALGESPVTLDVGGARILAMRTVLSFPDTGAWTIDAGLRLAQTEQTVSSFTRRLAGGSAAFLAVAVLGGLFLTRQALLPIAAGIRSAQQLNPDDLSVRLPRTVPTTSSTSWRRRSTICSSGWPTLTNRSSASLPTPPTSCAGRWLRSAPGSRWLCSSRVRPTTIGNPWRPSENNAST